MGQWVRWGLQEVHFLLGWLSPGKGLPNGEFNMGANRACQEMTRGRVLGTPDEAFVSHC